MIKKEQVSDLKEKYIKERSDLQERFRIIREQLLAFDGAIAACDAILAHDDVNEEQSVSLD